MSLHSPALGRTAAIVRNGGDVANGAPFQAGRRQSANGRLAARAGPADPHLQRADTMVARQVGSIHGRLLGGEGRALARAPESQRARALPGEHPALQITDGDQGVVERSLDVGHSARNVLALLLLKLLLLALFLRSGRAGPASSCYWFSHNLVVH